MEETIAIDFGTTNSAAYIYRNDKAELLPNLSEQGSYLFPSFVEYDAGSVITCSPAKKNVGKPHKFVVSCVKRLIGLSFQQYTKLEEKDIFGCDVAEGEDGYPEFIVSETGQRASCVDVAAELFRTIKESADHYCGRRFTKAYVTVPANFKDNQISAIRTAVVKAGLSVEKFITEPTAAAMSWCFEHSKEIKPNEKMLVYDFGGGTFDLSFLQCYSAARFRVLDVDGNPSLGGSDIDQQIMHFLQRTFQRTFGRPLLDPSESDFTRRSAQLRSLSEQVKIILSVASSYDVDFLDITGEEEEELSVSRAMLATLVRPILFKTVACIQRVLERGKLSPGAVRRVFLVGGSSKLPAVHELMERKFPKSTFPDVDPDHCVALGAMKMLMMDYGKQRQVEERIVISYGLRIENEVLIMLRRGTIIPAISPQYYFYNTTDFPESIFSEVYQWEGVLSTVEDRIKLPVEECTKVALFQFKNPDPKPKGSQHFCITFSLDVGGTLEVFCKDADTNEELNRTRIRGLYGGK